MPNYDTSYPPSLWQSTVSGLSPNTKAVGAAGFTLTVNGTKFTPSSVVSFEGDPRPTTYVSATQLTATIATIVAPARTAQVTVSTGGTFAFTITATELDEGTEEGVGETLPAAEGPSDSPQQPQETTEGPEGPGTTQEAPEASQAPAKGNDE